MKIAFTGGGTGGHIYPGLAIAARIQELAPEVEICWIGSSKGMDRALVEGAGFPFFGVPSGKFRRSFSLRNITDIFKIIAGFFAARRVLKLEKPALLFSKGGFVSVPPCAAAHSLGIPVFAHESDLSPGLATRINLRWVEKLFIPYKDSERHYGAAQKGKIVVSGNPVRPAFYHADAAKGRAFLALEDADTVRHTDRILLVLGGSQGSGEVNALIREALPELTKIYTVVHQTGEKGAVDSPAASSRYRPFAYIRDEMPDVLAAAEIVVCRGGAGTLWECAALRKPMIIIPLRGSGTRGDQVENARIFEKAGGAICLTDEKDAGKVSASRLTALVRGLAEDESRRRAMETALGSGGDAATRIARAIVERIGVQKGEES
jgi:UDP-N-acetylglucosamine--N-acetylmuramyl-(pentapeptide) pyrophosphoryl-undecaprenol N-acetylglucosamine transferase